MLEARLQCTTMTCTRRILGRMKLFILCVMVHGLSAEGTREVLSIGRWKEQVIAPEFLVEDRDDISDNALLYEDKRSFRPEGLGEVKRVLNSEDVGLQPRLVTRSLACVCETQYELRDLTEGHYPRYVTVSSCKPKVCMGKFNSCRLLHYTVHILSQRDLNEERYSDDDELQETPLPEALRHKWQMKPMKVPVACVPDAR